MKGIGQEPSRKLLEEETKLPKYQWLIKGMGRHAAALSDRVNALIRDYTEEVEAETGECISDDAHIVPIMKLLASTIDSWCQQVKTDIREDAGMDPGE